MSIIAENIDTKKMRDLQINPTFFTSIILTQKCIDIKIIENMTAPEIPPPIML